MVQEFNRKKEGRVISYAQIRDLVFFRAIANEYEPSIAKQLLPLAVSSFAIDHQHPLGLDHSKFAYICNSNVNLPDEPYLAEPVIKAGHLIPSSNSSLVLPLGSMLYIITHLSLYVLQKLMWREMPLTIGMKVFEKFMFYSGCEMMEGGFGGFIYRKKSEVDAIYYLLEGEVSIFAEEKTIIKEIARLEAGRLFGLFQIKYGSKYRQFQAKSHKNPTKLLIIPLNQLKIIADKASISIQQYLLRFSTQLHEPPYRRRHIQNIYQNKSKINKAMIHTIQSKQFNERVAKFRRCDQSNKKDPFWQFIQAKKLTFKIQQLNSKLKTQQDEMDNRNSKMSMKSQRTPFGRLSPERNTLYQSISNPQKFKSKNKDIALKQTGIRSLLQFTAIKKYLGRQSKLLQDDY